jgi:hypothetical protein
MLSDARIAEFRQPPAEVIAEMDGALDEPALRLALAVLFVSKDRDSLLWPNWAP